jgi:hypothetical protein
MTNSTERNESLGDVRRTLFVVATVGVAGAIVASLLAGVTTGVSVAFGAALGTANLWAVARVVRGFLSTGGARASFVAFGFVKMTALFAIMVLLLQSGLAELLPLLIGYGALPLGIVVSQLFFAPRVSEGRNA